MRSPRKATKRSASESEDVCPVCGRTKLDDWMKELEKVLEKVEASLQTKELKPTIGDYLRLLQFREELKLDEAPKEIKVTWVEPERKCEPEG